MKTRQRTKTLAGVALFVCAWGPASVTAEVAKNYPNTVAGETAVLPAESTSAGGAGFVRAEPRKEADPCMQTEVVASPSRPNWDVATATVQCGILQADYGWLSQPMGGGARQWMLVSSARYGLTPKLDLRWGLANYIAQSGGGLASMEGAGDQSVGATYRFHEQTSRLPAMAVNYGIKIPSANPAMGFGTGFFDHQFLFIAGEDVGRNHFDFNVVGTLAGGEQGPEGAVQFGLALTRPVTKRLSWILESYGGPLPGTADRYGAGLTGISFSVRPWLALDGAYMKAYTAGTPRQQVLFGLTHALRPWFGPPPSSSWFARLFGRSRSQTQAAH